MAKLLAFTLLVGSAFDLPAPWLDRAGLALLGLGFAALALPAGNLVRSAAERFAQVPPPMPPELLGGDELADVLARIRPYLTPEPPPAPPASDT